MASTMSVLRCEDRSCSSRSTTLRMRSSVGSSTAGRTYTPFNSTAVPLSTFASSCGVADLAASPIFSTTRAALTSCASSSSSAAALHTAACALGAMVATPVKGSGGIGLTRPCRWWARAVHSSACFAASSGCSARNSVSVGSRNSQLCVWPLSVLVASGSISSLSCCGVHATAAATSHRTERLRARRCSRLSLASLSAAPSASPRGYRNSLLATHTPCTSTANCLTTSSRRSSVAPGGQSERTTSVRTVCSDPLAKTVRTASSSGSACRCDRLSSPPPSAASPLSASASLTGTTACAYAATDMPSPAGDSSAAHSLESSSSARSPPAACTLYSDHGSASMSPTTCAWLAIRASAWRSVSLRLYCTCSGAGGFTSGSSSRSSSPADRPPPAALLSPAARRSSFFSSSRCFSSHSSRCARDGLSATKASTGCRWSAPPRSAATAYDGPPGSGSHGALFSLCASILSLGSHRPS
mmetsp:Transcript_7640/g.26895  ORF Transcript_7640/g.26895 Transcript_7640/m.26895 type:complete len:471 (-) Transcript_7640:285-1697(-)